jgi:hypothetical protein
MSGYDEARRAACSERAAQASAVALRDFWDAPEKTTFPSREYGFHFLDERGEEVSHSRLRSWDQRGWIERVAHPAPFGEGKALPIRWALTQAGREAIESTETDQ